MGGFMFSLSNVKAGCASCYAQRNGSKFFYETNGTEFFIKGVAYQQNGYYATYNSDIPVVDPLSDGPTCARDIPYLVNASINVVRAYAVLPGNDHSACMSELAKAGIYVVMDMTGNQAGQKINITAPYWDYVLFDYMTSVVDAFHNYTNVLGFFVGTEVINSTYTFSAPFVKAAARDVKAYIKRKEYRAIPVGYAMDDEDSIRQDTAAFLNCGSDQTAAVDFLGLNSYSWCGDSTLTQSGYSERIDEFRNLSIPIFLSEYGCNMPTPRNFTEVKAIYGDQMTEVFSGGIAYQYFHDTQNFGLVDVFGDSVSTSSDYSHLSQMLATATPTGVNRGSYNPTNSPQSCPTSDDTWLVVPTLPPTPYSRLCKCMMQTLTCISSTQPLDSTIGNTESVCEKSPQLCEGIFAYSWNGTYGAYATCNSTELASWVLNMYYISKGNDTSACESQGGHIQTPAQRRDSDCVALLQQAGAEGTGTVTSTPTPPASAATDNSSSGSSGSGNSITQTGGGSGTSQGSSGLSGGAIAGIVIGALAILAIIGTLAFFLWRARRKNRLAAGAGTHVGGETKVELPADGVPGHTAKAGMGSEADGRPVVVGGVTEYYKDGQQPGTAAELQAHAASPVELPAPHGVNEAGGIRSPVDTR